MNTIEWVVAAILLYILFRFLSRSKEGNENLTQVYLNQDRIKDNKDLLEQTASNIRKNIKQFRDRLAGSRKRSCANCPASFEACSVCREPALH